MNNLKRIFAIVFISLMLVSMVSGSITLGFASAETLNTHVESSKIWTDKTDYHPGENVTIYGTSFLPKTFIDLNVTKLNEGTNTLWKSITDANGNFEASYQIGAVGAPLYTVKATDGTNTATINFTDPPITRVQGPMRATSTSDPFTFTLSSAPISGNVLIAVIGTHRLSSSSERTVDGITQTGVTWTHQADEPYGTNPASNVEIWLGIVGSGASTSIQINLSGAADGGAVVDVCEYSGIATTSSLDKTGVITASSTSTSTGTTIATTQPSELWIGGITVGAALVQSAATNGFTLLDGAAYSSTSVAFLEKIVSATGTASSGTTVSPATRYVGCIATFRAAHAITLSPASGVVGSSVSVSGSGLVASHAITATFNGAAVTLSGTTSTDSSGSFTGATFTVPASGSGARTVAISDGTNSPSATYTVTSTVSLSPTSGNVGDIVTLTATGMVASHAVTATFGGSTVTLSPTTTDSAGGLTATFTVSASISGSKTLTLTDGSNSPTASFTVNSEITLAPNFGRVGDTVTVTATGMLGSHSGCTANLGGTAVTLSASTTTSTGGLTATFTVPASTYGSQTFTLTDGTNSPTASFTVTQIRLVQGPARTASTSSSIIVTMPSTPTTGNVLIAVIGTYRTSAGGGLRTVSSITESNVVWTKQASSSYSTGGYTDVEVWLGVVSASAGTSATITLSNSPTGAVADICEYSGIAASSYLDLSATGASASSTITDTGTTTSTTQPSELWIGGITIAAAAAQSSATNGFKLLDGNTGTQISVAYLEKVVSTTDTANSGTTIASNRWVGCIATFKAAHAITLSPASGVVGSSVSVSGSGLVASHAITATFNGAAVTLSGTTSTDSTGSFSGATFTVPASGSGARTVVISDGTNSPSATYTVNPSPFDHFVISVPASATSGTSFGSVTVTAYDVNNYVKMDYVGQVYFQSSDVGATLPYTSSSKYTFQAGDNGAHTFSGFTLLHGPSQTLTVTDGSVSATSSSITVNPGALDHFGFSTVNSPQITGTGFSVTITAYDANNNVKTDWTGSVSLTESNGGSVSPSSVTISSNGQVIDTVSVSLAGAGVTLGASGGGKTGTSNSFTVNGALTVSIAPGSWTMDVGQSKTFTATATGGSGSYTGCQWYVGGVAQVGQIASTFTYSPGSAGSYSITVTVTDSLGATSAQSSAALIVVAASPTVNISPVGPVTMDVGQTQFFTAAAIGGSGAISYQWYLDGVAVGSNSASYTYTASGTSASVTCKVTDSASTPVTSSVSNVVLITVNSSPSVSVAPLGPLLLDVGQSQIFTAAATGGTGALSYQWFVDSVLQSETSSSFTYSAISAGSLSVTCKVTDTASTPVTSPASNAVSITVAASPSVSIAPTGPLLMDVGQSQMFTATTVGGSGSLSYQWYLDGVAVGSNSASYSYVVSGSAASVTCVVTDSASIPVTSPVSNAVSVTVAASPTVSIAPLGPLTLNAGGSQMFTATASGGSGVIHYQWYLGSSSVGSDSSSYLFSQAAGSYMVTCKVTDSASIPVTSEASNTASVTVNAALGVNVLPASWAMDVGQSKLFTASAVGGSGSYTGYQWFVGGVAEVGQTAQTFTYSAGSIGSYLITVTVTDSLGATSPQSAPATVTVNSALVAPEVSAVPTVVDQGQTSVLSSMAVTTGTSGYTYQWLVKGPSDGSFSQLVGATLSGYSFVTTSSTAMGSWSFELQVTDGAGATVTSSPDTLVVVNSAPTVSVSPSSWTLNVGQDKVFSAAAVGGSGVYSGYQWYVGGVAVVGATTQTFDFVPASAGSYSITVTVTDSLGLTSAQSSAASVTVNAALSVSVAPVGPLTMDTGQAQLFTASVSGGSGTIHYQWYVDAIAVGTDSLSYSYTASGSSASITCKVTDSAPTPVTSPASNAVLVTVNSSPTVSIIPLGPLLMDVGQSQVFSAVVSGGSGVIHYQWFVDAVSAGTDSASYSYAASGTSASVTCKVTDSASTPVTSPASNAIAIAVAASPTVSVGPLGPLMMDDGQTQLFTASVSGGSGTIHYQWYVGVAVVGTDSSSYTFTASGTSASVTCKVTDSASTPVTSVASNAVSVTVTASPTVSIAPTGSLMMDVGQSQLFTASAIGGSGVIHYEWYVNGIAFGTDSSSCTYTASGSSASISCVVTDSASTPVTSPVSNAVSITVNAAQTVAVTPVLVTLDVGQSQTFTCTASGGSGTLHYQWYVGGLAVSGQTGATYSFTAGSSGSPTIYCIVTDSASTPFAVQSNTPTVTVASDLSVSVSPSSWTMDVGQSKMFTAVPVGGSGVYTSYQWYVDSVLQSETGSSFAYSSGSVGSHSITVTVTDSLGLTSVLSSAASVAVAASPTVSVGPLGPLMMDDGQTQLFTASVSGGSGTIHYQWYVGVAVVGTDSSSYTFTASGTSASVTCKVTDSASTPVTSVASNAVSVTVTASPTVSIAPTGSLMMDVGQSQLFTASAIGGSGVIHYEWYVNGIAFGTDSSSCTYTASGSSASISCVVTDSASTPVTSPVSNAVSITVNAAQTVAVTPVLVTLDVGQSQTFTCTASGGSGTLHYQWYVGGLAVSGQTGATYSFTAGSSGSPTIYCIVTDSASTPFAVQSNTPSITVNAAPTVSVSPSSWTMDVDQSKMFTAIPNGGSGSYTGYQWYVNGVAQSGKTTSTFTCSPGTGSYSITVTVTDSLGATSAQSSAATLTMNAAMSTPSASASSVVINQGQPSTLSVTGLSGGSTPYTYQWFEKTPGTGSYVIIGGATSSTYPFSTSSSTALGVWSFEVQVTDSASSAITVTSSAAIVIVNSGSTSWDFEDHTYTHIDMTTETPAQIAAEMTQMNALFAQYGLPAPIAIAYPQGYYNTAVESSISSYRLTARLASFGFSPILYPISNYYEMSSRELASDTSFAQVQAFIDQAIQQKGQLNLYSHLITNDLAALQLYPGCTPQLLGQVLDYLQTQQAAGNLQVLTVRQAYGAFNGQIAVVTISFDDALGTDYSAAYPLFQAHGLAGTSYIVGSAVDNAGWDPARLTWAQIEEMAETSPPAWTLNVNSSPSAGGSTSVSGTISVHQFSLPVTATAAPGYVFGGWSFDGTMSLTNPITLGQGQQAGGSVHTLTAYFVPITSSTIFTEDFESGSFTNWWASTISSTIVTSPVHSGTYSARASGYTYWDHYLDSGQSDLFFSGYVQFPQLPVSDQAVYLMYINDGSYTYTVKGGIYESSSGTSNQWLLGIGGDWFLSSSPANLQTNHWYFMEIEYNANGVGRMWVDGVLVSIGSGSAMLNAQDVQGGNPFGGTPSDFISYGDDYSVSSQYIPVGYQITVTQSANGQISPATTTYVQSSTVVETITPNSGYYIASITVDGTPIAVTSSSGQTVSFNNIQAVHTITATFTRNWQITVTQTANGLISPNSAIYNEGSNPSETITPNTGYYIASITVDEVAITVTSSNGQTVSFNNILASHTITATFAQITVTYQITVTQTANGLISPGTTSCPAGSSQDEVITPNSGYYIASINVDGNPMTVSSILGQTVSFNEIEASHTVTATYAQITWQITVIQTSNGLISPDTASYAQGNSPTETITPNSNWYIASITVDGSPVSVTSSSGQTVIFNNIQAAHTITATFAQITWQITVTQSSNGLISPSTTFYSQGSSPGETVTPANGYYVASITVDDIPITVTSSSGQTVIFNNIQAAHTITATFAQIPVTYQIIVTQSANGLISPDTSSYAQGSSPSEIVTPTIGYHIASITVDSVPITVTSITGQTVNFDNIQMAHTITATFAINSYLVTVTVDSNGLSNLATQTVDWNTPLNFAFTPNAGYHVADVVVNGTIHLGSVTSYNPTITGATTVDVTFAQTTYPITVTQSANGLISPDTASYVEGTSPSETITSNIGYHIASITVDGSPITVTSSSSQTVNFNNIQASHTITATFAVNVFTVTVNPGASGQITPATGSVNYGDTPSYTITPSTGYHIASITVNGQPVTVTTPAGQTYQFAAITTDSSISATFTIDIFAITVTQGANGLITGPSSADYGTDATFAFVADTGYHIVDVLVDGVSKGAVASYTITNVQATHTVTASFAINAFTIAASAGLGGSISPSGSVNVNYGGSQTFTVTPATGYHIDKVLIDGVESVAPYTISNVVDNSHTIVASFAIDTFAITVTQSANGVIAPDTTVVNYGASQTFSITPTIGYHIVDVLVGGVSQGAVSSYTFSNVQAAGSITASFAINAFTITVTQSSNGQITPVTGSVNYGDTPTYTITPNAGYHIASITVNSLPVAVTNAAGQTYQFAAITADSSIAATFASNTNTMDISLKAGWNMVSFPILPADTSFASIFSGKGYYQVLSWTGTNYVTATNAEAGKGYWILVFADTSLTISGNPVTSYEVDLPAGWSMIGGVNSVVSCASVFPGYYQALSWSGSNYVTATTLEPGKGYWVLVFVPTHIKVGS